MRGFVVLLALLVAAGCSGGGADINGRTTSAGSSGTNNGSAGDSTGPAPETTQEGGTTSRASDSVNIEQVASGSGGLGQRQVIVAPSADALSEATGAQVPSAGEGTYLAVFWGEKPTGGYTMEFLDVQPEGDRIVVQLSLKKPPPDAMVSQALTYPYAAAVMKGGFPKDRELTFVTRGGRELDWPVRRM